MKRRRENSSRPPALRAGIVHLLMSNIGSNALGFVSGIILARVLQSSGRGQYQMAAIFWGVVPGILCISLGTVLAMQNVAPKISWILRRCLIFTIAGASAGVAAIYVGNWNITICIILIIGSFGYMSSDLIQGALRGADRFVDLARYRWIDVGGGAIIIIVLGLVGILTTTLAVVALVASTAIAVFFGFYVFSKRVSGLETPVLKLRTIAQVHTSTIVRVVMTWTDQILVVALLGTAALGQYAVANSAATQFLILPSALNIVMLRIAKGESSEKSVRMPSAVALVFWVGVLASLTLVGIGPQIFGLIFGTDFSISGTIAAILVLSSTLAGSSLLIETYLFGLGDVGYATMARTAGFIGLVIGAAWFVTDPTIYKATFVAVGSNVVPALLLVARVVVTHDVSLRSLAFPSLQTLKSVSRRNGR